MKLYTLVGFITLVCGVVKAATVFPTGLDSLPNPTATDTFDTPGLYHDEQHANANDAIEALQALVGTNGSTVVTSHSYKLLTLTGTNKAAPYTYVIYMGGTGLSYPNLSNGTYITWMLTGSNLIAEAVGLQPSNAILTTLVGDAGSAGAVKWHNGTRWTNLVDKFQYTNGVLTLLTTAVNVDSLTNLTVVGNVIADGGVFTNDITVKDAVYGAAWDGNTAVPTKNAVFDKIELLTAGSGDDVWWDGNNITHPNLTSTVGLTWSVTSLTNLAANLDAVLTNFVSIVGWDAITNLNLRGLTASTLAVTNAVTIGGTNVIGAINAQLTEAEASALYQATNVAVVVGLTTEVTFNNAGTMDGDPEFIFDPGATSKKVTVPNFEATTNAILASLNVGNGPAVFGYATASRLAIFNGDQWLTNSTLTESSITDNLTEAEASALYQKTNTTVLRAGDTMSGTLYVTGLTNNALNAGYVTFSGATKQQTDDADLTFATDTLTATKVSAPTSVATASLVATNMLYATASTNVQVIGLLSAHELLLTNAYEYLWIPASAMLPDAATGPSFRTNTWATTTDGNKKECYDFDSATEETLHFDIQMPLWWDGADPKFKFVWKAVSSVDGYTNIWGAVGGSLASGDTGGNVSGTAATIEAVDEGNTNQIHISAAVTCDIGGTPAAGDWVWFKFYRDADATADRMTGDASLFGVWMQWKRATAVPAPW